MSFLQSKMRVISKGRAVEDKKVGSTTLLVHPIEIIPLVDGSIESNPEVYVSEGVDFYERVYTEKVISDIAMETEWLGLDTNRRTPPDVRRGEQISIWQYANEDRYFWTCDGRDDHLRRLETVTWAYSDIPNVDVDEKLSEENCYTVEVCTRTGRMFIQTSLRNDEVTKYNIELDAKNGKLTIKDTHDNVLHLNSPEYLWELINGKGTFLKLNKTKVHLNAAHTTIDSHVTLNGDLVHKGNLKQQGNIQCSGTANFGGGVTAPTFHGLADEAKIAWAIK